MRTIEVERLTRSLKDTMRQRDEAADEIECLRAENERLRGALNEIIIFSDDYDCAVKIACAALEEKK